MKDIQAVQLGISLLPSHEESSVCSTFRHESHCEAQNVSWIKMIHQHEHLDFSTLLWFSNSDERQTFITAPSHFCIWGVWSQPPCEDD